MAKQTVMMSDLTGQQIPSGEEAQVAITYPDGRKGRIVLDVSASEVADMAGKGRRMEKRGRKPAA